MVVLKGREQGFEKRVMRQNPIFSTFFGSVTFTRAKYRIFVSLPFSQSLVPLLFTLPLPPIPISHQRSRQRMFFYSCFLYFLLSFFIDYLYWQVPPLPLPEKVQAQVQTEHAQMP